MKCPRCGNEKAIRIDLLTGESYLCPTEGCRYHDADREREVADEELAKAVADVLDALGEDDDTPLAGWGPIQVDD